ncbi:hypothetical protein [Sulfolobus acidocaldarius]|uniref:Uncharacterized protein n=4 Tax=Sulfolobus acidocaldarius TaxID=2285 RepID=Q4J9Z5_SULAC|nr:hypothetical protein [Sulfolobus acidocaldarius]AAY80379.1 hypothetical protein Saci_1022 [Sulfolobus acidocaldarius DSM 639]AGE70962.1 hypothetical protein SacN8_04955 [Sulfolobus acidocaldarius N8]AGE73233.1 hypothetical protein SacRon12I_04945 [Sulfolobus acidocaldarius Ron12/I]ALU28734.1 hypothetical protein ATY89_01350 [Sulfolobus acidocaldarius]ALU31453.1 hypothetical protein ATZ20_04385 [Sulfolobus acidocaldarius]
MIDEILNEIKEKVRNKTGKELSAVKASFRINNKNKVVETKGHTIYINPIFIEGFQGDPYKIRDCVSSVLLVEYLRLLGFDDNEILDYVKNNETEIISYVQKLCKPKWSVMYYI